MSRVDDLFAYMAVNHPRSLRGIEESRALVPELFDSVAAKFLGWAATVHGEAGYLPRCVPAFAAFSHDVIMSQARYEADGHYENSSFAACEAAVYADRAVMDDYLWGVFLTNFLWSHHDARGYRWTKQPFSTDGLTLLCRHLAAAVRVLTTGPKKVLALDLDNTLWGGVVGETGAMGVAIRETPDGESYPAFQQHCKGLSQRGVLLAVASKNNPADALEPFEKNPDMELKRSDFAGFEATWDPRSHSLARLAADLRLGLDSFVFFDDNPAEREHIRRALPEVEVVDVPEEPALYVRALESGLWFEAVRATAEDAARSAQYQAESARKSQESAFASLEDYLVSLEMRADVRAVDDDDRERVVQLLGKTNQFNLTRRRHRTDVVQAWMADPRAVLLTVRVADRFGDRGLVVVILGVPDTVDATTLVVDTWLMSCRVIGRTVEQLRWGAVPNRARLLAYRRSRGAFLPTPRTFVRSA